LNKINSEDDENEFMSLNKK